MVENTDLIINIVIGLIIIGFVLTMMKGTGMSEMVVGARQTRHIRVDEEPRDHYERFMTNHRKTASDSKPKQLKFLYTSGDLDVPPKKIGIVTGLEPIQEGYLVFVKHHRLQWGKPHIIPREMVSDANRRVIFVQAKAFTHNGLIRIPIPRGHPYAILTPDEVLTRCRSEFRALFREMNLSDAEEDAAWSQSMATNVRERDRINMAEVEVPNLGNRRYVSEDQAKRGS